MAEEAGMPRSAMEILPKQSRKKARYEEMNLKAARLIVLLMKQSRLILPYSL